MENNSGHKDSEGIWIPESNSAKLRNKLSPFWTLSQILLDGDFIIENNIEFIKEMATRCEKVKPIIIEIIEDIEKP